MLQSCHSARIAAIAILALSISHPAARAQRAYGWSVLVPESSIERPEDRGLRAHTNHLLVDPLAQIAPAGGLGPHGAWTPAQLKASYDLPTAGGSGAIAIIGAYNNTQALSEFNTFSAYYGFPQEPSSSQTASTNRVFQVVYARGSIPAFSLPWAQECSGDFECAHSMAPNAKVYLVEAASNSFSDLFYAVDVASSLPGVTEISMSWTGGEWSGERGYDYHFSSHPGITYVAAAGDVGGEPNYPAVSPYVVGAGGTTLLTNYAGVFTGEQGWSDGGGGKSAYEPRPSWQYSVAGLVGSYRGSPDLSFDSAPASGVSVYGPASSSTSGWFGFSGTSVAAPSLAGIMNLAGGHYGTGECSVLYSGLGTSNFRDITSGYAGSFECEPGWDFVTGVGSCQGVNGK